jgi:hypothetical protein
VSSTRALVEMSWRRLVAGDEAVAMVTRRNCRSRVRGYLAKLEILSLKASVDLFKLIMGEAS